MAHWIDFCKEHHEVVGGCRCTPKDATLDTPGAQLVDCPGLKSHECMIKGHTPNPECFCTWESQNVGG